MFALDENLGDIHSMIVGMDFTQRIINKEDREIIIFQELKTRLLLFNKSFVDCCNVISELDW